MKTKSDPRHLVRRKIVQALFAESFIPPKKDARGMTKNIVKKQSIIDKKIVGAAPQWPIEKINKIDLAVLRLAVYELNFSETPEKVVIDEAIELSKEFGNESSSDFINGVLGKMMKND